MEPTEQNPSPEGQHRRLSRTASRVTTRDYLDDNLSRTRSQTATSRSRYGDYNIGGAPGTLRHRVSNFSMNLSPGRAPSWRQQFVEPESATTGRRSVQIAAPSEREDDGGGGVMDDTASRNFSLAGPLTNPQILDTVAANQPYVAPGYAQLNPAYDQPVNVRPVWGLAKPLPRVLRPGMVPTKDELEKDILKERESPLSPPPVPVADLEAGRIEPSLRPDKVTPTLDTIRREREIALIRAYESQQQQDSPGFSPFSVPGPGPGVRRSSDAPTVTPSARVRLGDPGVIEEEEDTASDLSTGPLVEEPEQLDSQTQLQPQAEPPELALPEAVAGLRAAKEQEEEALLAEQEERKLPYEDAVPLTAYEAEDEEIHNLHTHWSIIRLRFREPLAELLGITVQYTLGFSANLSMTVTRGAAGVNDTGTWAWGLSTMLAIYIAGGISGAHLNPAISVMLYIFRGFPLSKVPGYIAAQMLGAFLATLIAYGIFRPGLMALVHLDSLTAQPPLTLHTLSNPSHPTMTSAPTARTSLPMTIIANFLTFPHHAWLSQGTSFTVELVATSILTISVLALGDDTNAPPGAGMNAFIVGLLITVLGMAFGSLTGLAMNPVRDFGPRVALTVLAYHSPNATATATSSPSTMGTDLWSDGYWFTVAWLGPLLGAVLGGLLYDAAIFVGGESPVNYPARRIRRAARKWRKRWKMRMGFYRRSRRA